MIRRGILLFALVYAGCKGHKSCGDGSVAVPSDDPDGGVSCVPAPDEEGGTGDGPHGDANHLPDGHVDGPPGGVCGDGICNASETCETCPTDCGSCGPVCGDGVCSSGETCTSCPTDCFCPPDAAVDAPPQNCPPPQTITSSITANLVAGGPNCFTPTCGSTTNSGPDAIYVFTPSVTGTCHANTTNPGTTFDTILSVRTAPNGPDVTGGCNDDASGMTPNLASYVSWSATAFTTYYIIVDAYSATGSGTYQLTVACP